ncbi:hypothetical protein [Actinomyces marmotae]|uniref:Uncharacterized protein n=1 Tax=Actinomyces marmotae TaxID=2737173 RepID=A0A6M8B8C8_9ACTO|nr:hypothetical protein [Actinomyces marmotae]QKD79651.1 hypothetical protein HPC72_04710 [Actinomyces marmotae]
MGGDERLSRLRAARSALASAEERAGLRSARQPLAPRAREGRIGDPPPGPWLGVGAATSGAVVLTGSTSALLALLAHRQGAQGWCAVVGGDDLGWCAAAHLGLALDRVLAVPIGAGGGAGARAARGELASASILAVTAALLDGVDALLITARPASRLRARDRATLTARARDRGALILSPIPWEGARVLRAEPRGALVPLHASAQGAQEMPAGYLDALSWRLRDEARGSRLELRLGGRGMEREGPAAPATPGTPTARRGSA